MFELWWLLLGSYNRGGLSRYEDKLPAIAGVASYMQACLGDEYVAGLWKKYLLQHLTWFVPASESDGHLGWSLRSRPQLYQAPSWSWASVNDRVTYLAKLNSKPLATVLDYKVSLAGASVFGRVADGYVRIQRRLTLATFSASDEKLRETPNELCEIFLASRSAAKILVLPELMPDIRVGIQGFGPHGFITYPVRDAIGSRSFYLLPMYEDADGWAGLLLQRTKNGIHGQYHRLGAFAQLRSGEKSFMTFQSHVPKLDPEDYEDQDGEEYILTII